MHNGDCPGNRPETVRKPSPETVPETLAHPIASGLLPVPLAYEATEALQSHQAINQGDVNLGEVAQKFGQSVGRDQMPGDLPGHYIRTTLCGN